MKQIFSFLLLIPLLFCNINASGQNAHKYGNNKELGKYAVVNGIKMYYEEYGSGNPLFLIHGNGASIESMHNQIAYFQTKHRVIVADSRGHGKSELNTDSLTYLQMAKDWSALASVLNIDSVNIIGWSDGGIIALLMGINHPEKVKKIVAMGANLRPDTTAIYTWAVNWGSEQKKMIETKIKEKDATKNWNREMQLLSLCTDQPSITKSDLSKIKAPVLIMAGDKDIIREEHTVEIFQGIPKAHLCILPGETHFIPVQNPELFNSISEKFIEAPFKRPYSDWTKW